ncbi:MAG: aminotransferase class V-fold PLP-dependent enzyme [Pseudomonadota bacterium]|nr:aminotransferase class V-fold PLP-dependent enzyme [Pseudomonadota bacterium]
MDLTIQFPHDRVTYLNHAAVAPWPKVTRDAIVAFADQNLSEGATDYSGWMATEQSLREKLRCLINANSSDDIALLKNTSEAISVVAWGFPWRPGDNLVLCRQEFPSNRIPWESLARLDVSCRYVDLANETDPEGAMIAACDERTKLLAVSSVQYADGFRMNLKRLGEACSERNIAFFVDAIQSLGAIPFDLDEVGADFVVADGHKWMLGPEGVALFYCSPAWRDRLRLYEYGWHMTQQRGDFDAPGWDVAQDARRFECGSPNTLGVHALNASLGLLLEIGIGAVWREIAARTAVLMEIVQAAEHLELVSVSSMERRSGIVTFRHHSLNGKEMHRQLMAERVICAQRLGGVRFSPHFYTDMERMAAAVDLANRLLR